MDEYGPGGQQEGSMDMDSKNIAIFYQYIFMVQYCSMMGGLKDMLLVYLERIANSILCHLKKHFMRKNC
jgi:hypothetical protein